MTVVLIIFAYFINHTPAFFYHIPENHCSSQISHPLNSKDEKDDNISSYS